MAKKPAPLPKRLARLADRLSHSTAVAVLRPRDARRSLAEVCWEVLEAFPGAAPAVHGPGELADVLAHRPSFGTAEAAGWIAGALCVDLVHPPGGDPAAGADAAAVEREVLAALGPGARWLANSGHPLPGRAAGGRGWSPVTTATFDLLVAARGADLDLVVLRAQED